MTLLKDLVTLVTSECAGDNGKEYWGFFREHVRLYPKFVRQWGVSGHQFQDKLPNHCLEIGVKLSCSTQAIKKKHPGLVTSPISLLILSKDKDLCKPSSDDRPYNGGCLMKFNTKASCFAQG